MSLPVQTDITTGDFPSRGLPYLDLPAKSSIDTQTMDYPSRGLPLVTNDDFSGGGPPPATTIIIPQRMRMGMGA